MVFTIVVYDKSDTQFSNAFSILVDVKTSFGSLTTKEPSVSDISPAEWLIKDLSENLDNALFNLRYVIYKEYSTYVFTIPKIPNIEHETERWAVQGSIKFFDTILKRILGHHMLVSLTSGTKSMLEREYKELSGHSLNICMYRILSVTAVPHSYISAIDISNRVLSDPMTKVSISTEDIRYYKLNQSNNQFPHEEKIVMLVEHGDNAIKCGKLRIANKFGYDFRCAVDPTFADSMNAKTTYDKQISTQEFMTTLTSLSGGNIWTNPYVTEMNTYI